MTDDRVEGGLKKAAGKLQDAWGGLSGDGETQAKGKLNEAAGSVQAAFGKAQDQVGDIYENAESYIRDQPGVAAAVIFGVGLVIGLMLRGGRKTVYVRR